MQCPKCFSEDTTAISDSHYVCNNINCHYENGDRTQFRIVADKSIKFPYNQIFVNRDKSQFYRKPYLELETVTQKPQA